MREEVPVTVPIIVGGRGVVYLNAHLQQRWLVGRLKMRKKIKHGHGFQPVGRDEMKCSLSSTLRPAWYIPTFLERS